MKRQAGKFAVRKMIEGIIAKSKILICNDFFISDSDFRLVKNYLTIIRQN